jgi:hypothetical protein
MQEFVERSPRPIQAVQLITETLEEVLKLLKIYHSWGCTSNVFTVVTSNQPHDRLMIIGNPDLSPIMESGDWVVSTTDHFYIWPDSVFKSLYRPI